MQIYPLAMSNSFLNASKKMKATRFGKTNAGAHIAKVLPTAFASLIVFLVVGIWHGASWKYVAFGLWNGGVIMLSILMKPLFDGALKKLHINPSNFLWGLFQILRTFIIVCIGYVFDIAPSFKQAIWTFKMILIGQKLSGFKAQLIELGLGKINLGILGIGALVILVSSIIQEKTNKQIRTLVDKKPVILEYCIIVAGVITVAIFGIYGPGYNPADFVYMQF